MPPGIKVEVKMVPQKTVEGIVYDSPEGLRRQRKPAGYWDNPEMIDNAYDYSKKKHKKVTKAILILDHGSGVYHGIERVYKKFNIYLGRRGEKVNLTRSAASNGKKSKKHKKAFDPMAGNDEETDSRGSREHYSFKDACEGYKILRQDSKVPIPENKYRDYYGREAMKAALMMDSYLKFREFNEKAILEERIRE